MQVLEEEVDLSEDDSGDSDEWEEAEEDLLSVGSEVKRPARRLIKFLEVIIEELSLTFVTKEISLKRN